MADIQQWRRKIQPTRTRTPAVEHDDPEGVFAPTTPRNPLKPKFSSYFTQHANNAEPTKKEGLSPRDDEAYLQWPSWPANDPYPSPDADVLIDSVMCRILGSPYDGLSPRFNGVLLQIFEGYRSLADEKQRLQCKASQDADKISALETIMQQSARQWNQEKQDYKAEIKRLELLLAKGKGGLAEVTLARQDSVLRSQQAERRSKARKHDSLETIFQFMEKNKRVEEKVWGFQRATMRRKSPSADMRRLSKSFMSRNATYPELLPETLMDGPSTLARASYLEQHAPLDRARAVSDPKTSFSEDDTMSTFSCAGDLLPDEVAHASIPDEEGDDADLAAIKRIAQVLAKRRNMDADIIVPKLLQLFAPQAVDNGPDMAPKPSAAHGRTATLQSSSIPSHRKNTKLMAKASGFFHKLKPQLNVDTALNEGRRFSFERGDDSLMSAPGQETTPRTLSSSALGAQDVSNKALRKSASTPLLARHVKQLSSPEPEQPLSPVQPSPSSSTPCSEGKRTSKIPTPVYSSTLARPRQERESSESSLLTAIKCAESTNRRSSSISSSGHSSPSASGMDCPADSRGTASNRLLEHTQALRGNAFAAAAASRAIESADPSPSAAGKKCMGVRKADVSERRKENVPPISLRGRTTDHEHLRLEQV